MGAFETHAGALIEHGYAAVPIMPGSKIPGYQCAGLWTPLLGWQKRYLDGRKPQLIELAAWGSGDAGIGVVGGKASHGLVAIDIDTDDTATAGAIVKVLPATPVSKIGQKGETRFFYGPDITTSQSWNIDGKRVCDLIGPGRQTVLPPTIHPDTRQPYRWQGASLEHYDPEDLPLITPDIIGNIGAALVPFGWHPEPARGHSGGNGGNGAATTELDLGADTPHRALNNFALTHLSLWVPALALFKCRPVRGGYEAVATWRPSSTGRPDKVRKLNLKIALAGIRDFGAGGVGNGRGYTPIDLVMAAHDCDLDTAFKFLSDRTGWAGKPIVLVSEPELAAAAAKPSSKVGLTAEPLSLAEQTALTGEDASPRVAIDDLEQYAHDVPGVVGEAIEWIVATARRPNRVMALGAAIALCGTLIGRRVAGPTGAGTHLYVVVTALTGSGKQHSIDCVHDLMIAAGAQQHIGASSFMSGSAICNAVLRCPLQLCCMDELGQFLAKTSAQKASVHERAMSGVLRSLWGLSFGLYTTPEWADRPPQHIHSPALGIYGTSTPDELLRTLQGEAIENGFLSRFLVLQSQLRADDREPLQSRREVPESLAAGCRRLYRWHGDDIELLDIKRPVEQRVTRLPWASPAAEQEFMDFIRMVDGYMNLQSYLQSYFVRITETAIRLATIRAAGRSFRSAKISTEDVRWGAGIAWQAGQQLATGARNLGLDTERGRQVTHFYNHVQDCNRAGKIATVRAYMRKISCALKATEIKDMVKQMCEAGLIELAADGGLHALNPDGQRAFL